MDTKKSDNAKQLIMRLSDGEKLTSDEYRLLIESRSEEVSSYAASLADRKRREYYGNDIYIRGLIEAGNCCRNDCFYCGIRKSNKSADRYILTDEDIVDCCAEGYSLGFRTFVLQGGDNIFTAEHTAVIVKKIKSLYPDCAVTLSLGEYGYEEYRLMHDAGADRYLLRHETADREHYGKLHPGKMSFDNRMECLHNLRKTGFQVGCGFMVGSPFQTSDTLAKDLKFIETFSPEMCGIGPFIPASGTPFEKYMPGTLGQTLYLLSLIRLIKPNILLPATTALGTIDPLGREKGIMAGANVIMPNLSPLSVRKKYSLYDNKICTGDESAQCIRELGRRMESAGYRIVTARGDIIYR